MKSLMPAKAQQMDPDELGAWLAGKVPRRILTIPFGGPIPSPKSKLGVDLDGEHFSERTDIYGEHRALRETRVRLGDFSHSAFPPGPNYGDPTGRMSGHVIGKSILDEEPEDDGWWSDFWLKKGEERLRLIKALVRKGGQLFGSSQPLPTKAKAKDPETGEILVWPHWMQTLTTAPQNTYSVLKPAKAALDELDLPAEFRAIVENMRDLESDLRLTSNAGDDVAKAGRELSTSNEHLIDDAIEEFAASSDAYIGRMREFLERVRTKYRKQE